MSISENRNAVMVLAAGSSRRLGSVKQLAILGPERLLERAIRTAKEAGATPVIVVLGAFADRIQTETFLGGARIILNDAWQKGMASSIQAGLEAVSSVEANEREVSTLLIMACDQPSVTSEHLRRLLSTCNRTGNVVASAYAGRAGIPAAFPRSFFPQLRDLEGDEGARTLLRSSDVLTLELPAGDFDIDTPEDLELLKSWRPPKQ